jgi:transcriptional regulator with XRE-family HTH domain
MPWPNGERIRQARQKTGVTCKDFAADIGISRAHQDNIESARATASIEVLYRVANKLGLDISEVLADSEREKAGA